MDLPLTRRSALELAAAIASGTVSAADVVAAHIAVLERIERTNALAADRFDLARAEAKAADARVAAGEADLPPLLGVPMTIKELIGVAGMPHSGGFPHRRSCASTGRTGRGTDASRRRDHPRGRQHARPVLLGRDQQSAYGRTSNAYDPTRTAGGSSGGDGAMVGSGGAPIALGSDMGGSIRIPAFVNGVFGHLPSPGLVPITGHFPMPAGEFRRTLFVGPLTRRAEDLMPVLRIIAGPDGEDPNTTPMTLGDPAEVSLPGCACSSPATRRRVPLRPPLRERSTARRVRSARPGRTCSRPRCGRCGTASRSSPLSRCPRSTCSRPGRT